MNNPNQIAALRQENEKLKQEVEVWKKKLIQTGLSHGVRPFSTSAPCQPPAEVKQTTTIEKEVPKAKEEKKVKEPKKKEPGKHHI